MEFLIKYIPLAMCQMILSTCLLSYFLNYGFHQRDDDYEKHDFLDIFTPALPFCVLIALVFSLLILRVWLLKHHIF